MKKKIKIGDTVVYSPSLTPSIGKVVGCFGDHITVDIGNHILNWKVDDCCPITDEEHRRFLDLQQKQ